MTDVLECDAPIRPIKPGDRLPPPDQPTAFVAELRKILAGLLGR